MKKQYKQPSICVRFPKIRQFILSVSPTDNPPTPTPPSTSYYCDSPFQEEANAQFRVEGALDDNMQNIW